MIPQFPADNAATCPGGLTGPAGTARLLPAAHRTEEHAAAFGGRIADDEGVPVLVARTAQQDEVAPGPFGPTRAQTTLVVEEAARAVVAGIEHEQAFERQRWNRAASRREHCESGW